MMVMQKQKAGSRPAVLVKGLRPSSGARAERGSTRAGSHFLDFLAFLAFFAFFAFFAFLAIASSFGLMGGNATRGMLGGGPTSQYPRIRSQQIRGVLPRAVTLMSSRYPQLLCVLARVSLVVASLTLTQQRRAHSLAAGSAGAPGRVTRPAVHQFKTTVRIALFAVRNR